MPFTDSIHKKIKARVREAHLGDSAENQAEKTDEQNDEVNLGCTQRES